MRRWLPATVVLSALNALPWALDPLRLRRMAIEILYFGLFVVSFDLLFGYAALLSFGHAVTFRVGGCGLAIDRERGLGDLDGERRRRGVGVHAIPGTATHDNVGLGLRGVVEGDRTLRPDVEAWRTGRANAAPAAPSPADPGGRDAASPANPGPAPGNAGIVGEKASGGHPESPLAARHPAPVSGARSRSGLGA